jgi:outer membrane protein assembly factor BamE
MQKYIPILLVIFIIGQLQGCSGLQFPGVYKIPIEQGNVITQEMVDQLKPGMSREQVEYIMGSPLIKDTFNPSRWDYVYSIQRGKQPREQYRMSIFFENGQLSHFSGDFVPSENSNTPEENMDEDDTEDDESYETL